MYTPGKPPAGGNVEDLKRWLETELGRIQTDQQAAVDGVLLKKLYAAPKKIRDGLTVLADGTTWNPGGGQGVYTWYAGVWNKLG